MKRIQQLDGIRGIAILLVLVWHYLPCQIVAQPLSFLAYFKKLLSLTWSGVDLFFVLSGFLITGILLDNRDASNYFRVFYLRRVCRIFPLYFLLLVLFLCCSSILAFSTPAFDWLFAHPISLWSYATFTQNLLMGIRGDFGPHWLGITWSLAVEEQFYLFIPILIYLFRRSTVFYVLSIFVLLAPLLRIGSPGFHAFVNTPWRADSLLSGACLAILIRSNQFEAMCVKHKRFLYILFVMLLAGTAMMILHPSSFRELSHFWLAGLYSVFVLIAVVDVDGYIGRILSHRILVWFGTMSYGIYMFHQAVSGLLHGLLRGQAPIIKTAADVQVTGLAFLITLLLAALSYRFFEQPFLQLGHRFRYIRISRNGKIPFLKMDIGKEEKT